MPPKRNTLGGVGAGLLVGLACVGTAAPVLAPFAPDALAGPPLSPPSTVNFLGTDDLGQDILSALIYGTRLSLAFGLVAATLATGIAATVGLSAGYAKGPIDAMLMRLVDAMLVLPVLPLTIVLGAFLGAGISSELLVVSIVMWARPARELRAQALSVAERGEVQASYAMGGSTFHVVTRHILPRTLPLLVPQFVRLAKNAIMLEASLSFLGLGDPTAKSWGTILYYAQVRSAFLTDAWAWWVIPPGLCIAATVVGLAFVGYAVEERARPNLRVAHKVPRQPPRPTGHDSVRGAAADQELLRVDSLTIEYDSPAGAIRALHNVSLEIKRGEVVGLIGESGSGKTTLAHAVLGLLNKSVTNHRSGVVTFDGLDMLSLSHPNRRAVLGKRLALIPQSAMNALNPVLPILNQVTDVVTAHGEDDIDARGRAASALRAVGIPEDRATAYPHELSGGMRQRVLIAMALVNKPCLIIADEITTGLDVLVQEEILNQLASLRSKHDVAILFISHDLPTVTRIAGRLCVMQSGQVVESGSTTDVTTRPTHPYTKQLLAAVPEARVVAATSTTRHEKTLLTFRAVTKTYTGRFGHRTQVRALHDISFDIHDQEIVGLVGGSGGGKSTIARLIMGLELPDSGEITFRGASLPNLKGKDRRSVRRQTHLVFQDPYQSLAPHWTVARIVAEPLRIHRVRDDESVDNIVMATLSAVFLTPPEQYLHRFPHELSGGERQRVALARAAVHKPMLIVADEPTSLLDAHLRMEVIKAMQALRTKTQTAFLYITHDLTLACWLCDRLLIVKDGQIVENGYTSDIVSGPAHEYTAALVRAAAQPSEGLSE